MHSGEPAAQDEPDDLASALKAFRSEILDRWRARVVMEVPAAASLHTPILVDSLPILYENIVGAIALGEEHDRAVNDATLANVHGRERAKLTEYSPRDVIHELQIFREIIFSFVQERGLFLRKGEAEIIGKSIELVARESISGYSAASRELNEAFITSLSHDLRNPLNVASASAQLIELTTSDPRSGALAKRVLKKLREADAMIQTLLDAAVLKGHLKLKLHLEQFEIMSLVEEVCSDIPVTGQHVRVFGEKLSGFWCYKLMKRVLENLTSNAQKHGDTSKPITVVVQKIDERMMLSVHNEGDPIPETQIANMFSTSKRIEDLDIKGWGLGLPFIQNVVQSHGGSVVVDSAEGAGTTFTVSIPVDARPYIRA